MKLNVMLPKPVYISQEPVFDKCVLENGVVKFYEKYGRILMLFRNKLST